ncbi:MAG: choice-of-anchor P family protein [Streptosporangiaceae bacterium]
MGTTIFIGHASVTGAGPISGTLGGAATATSVDGPEGTSAASFPAGVSCMASSSTETNGAGVTFSPLTTGAVTDTATGVDNATTLSAKTSSTVSNVKVANILSFGGVKASATAAKSGSGVTSSGSVTLTNPKLLGTSVPVLPAHPKANYTVKVNGDTLVLNRQVKTANGITIQALYLTGQSIGTIVVGSASASAYPAG